VRIPVRVGAVAGLVLTGLIALAAPAQAHPLRYGDDASNWRSVVTNVTPTGSVRAAMGDGVLRLTVTLGRAQDVVIAGYDNEPFVQLRPSGAFVNSRSSTTYAVKGPQAVIPKSVDDKAPPAWQRVNTSPTWSWHDVRTHWPGYALPPPVEADQSTRQQVLSWSVPVTADGVRGAIAGVLDWVPGPSGGAGALIATAGFAAVAGLFVWRRRPWIIAAGLACLLAADVAHSIGMTAGRVGDVGSRLAALPGHGGLPLALWLLSGVALVLLLRRREFGAYAAALLAALFCFTEALPSLAVLWRSQAVNALPVDLTRALIAVLTGVSVGTFVAASLFITNNVRNYGGST